MTDYTHKITLDFGVLGEHALDVLAELVPGERGSRRGGKLVEPDVKDSWNVKAIYHPALSCEGNRDYLYRSYLYDPDFAECVDEALSAIDEQLEPLPFESALGY